MHSPGTLDSCSQGFRSPILNTQGIPLQVSSDLAYRDVPWEPAAGESFGAYAMLLHLELGCGTREHHSTGSDPHRCQ